MRYAFCLPERKGSLKRQHPNQSQLLRRFHRRRTTQEGNREVAIALCNPFRRPAGIETAEFSLWRIGTDLGAERGFLFMNGPLASSCRSFCEEHEKPTVVGDGDVRAPRVDARARSQVCRLH